MTTPSEGLRLAGDFPPADLADWQKLTLAVLRKSGVATDDTPPEAVAELLTTTTYDGIKVPALYTSGESPASGVPGQAPFTRGGRAEGAVRSGWDVRQRHADPDPKVTAEAVLADLANGATSLWIEVGSGRVSPENLRDVLAEVRLDLAGVVLDAGSATPGAAEAFLALVDERGAQGVRANLGADPFGWSARTGTPADLVAATALAQRCAGGYPEIRAITVDATVSHDAGGSDAQELGYSLAAGVGYLRALAAAGLSESAALGQLEFRYAATVDQFLTIAKLRAARRLWARVADACGALDAGAQLQHAVTSSAMMTARDPWVNMLRTTIAGFAAAVGGADALTIQPFDACLGLPDGFSRRIARNTQALLQEESHLARVIDPAGGSWYVEQLTDDLAKAAWAEFQAIEQAGGLGAALSSGLIAERLDATWQRRVDNLAHRRDPITGVSEFPNLDEQLPARPAAAPAPAGGLPRHRYAEVFESRRDRADVHAATSGAAPAVFLATIGSVAAHTARATFASNLLAAGGIQTPRSGAGTEVSAIAETFAASGSTVACICGTDKAYVDLAEPIAAALKAAGARRVWLAGSPRKKYAGVDSYLYLGCNAVEVIDSTLDDLGVAR